MGKRNVAARVNTILSVEGFAGGVHGELILFIQAKNATPNYCKSQREHDHFSANCPNPLELPKNYPHPTHEL
jgi:hypothetical protein